METVAQQNRRNLIAQHNWNSRPGAAAPAMDAAASLDPRALGDLMRRMMDQAKSIDGPIPNSFIFTWRFTPEDCALILDQSNYGNRLLSRHHVEELKAEHESGNWVPNVDPIVLGPQMRLLGGQHRLTMVRETGKPLTFIVVFGATEEMKFGLDRGKPWSIADKMHIDREAVSAARVIVALTSGKLGKGARDSEIREKANLFSNELTKSLSLLKSRRSLLAPANVAAFSIASRNKKHADEIERLAVQLSSYSNDGDRYSRSILQTLEQYASSANKGRCLLALRLLDRLFEYCTGRSIPDSEKPTTTGLLYFMPDARATV